MTEGSTALSLRLLWIRIDGMEARRKAGELSEGTYLRGLTLLLEQVRKLEGSLAANAASLSRAGLDDTVARKIAEGDRMLRELIEGARTGAAVRVAALPADGNLDQLVHRPDLEPEPSA